MAPIILALGAIGAALYFGTKLGDNNRAQRPLAQLPPPPPTTPGPGGFPVPGGTTSPGQPGGNLPGGATLGSCIVDQELREEFLIQLQDNTVPPATLEIFANVIALTCPVEATALRAEAQRRRTVSTQGLNFPTPPTSPDNLNAWAAQL